MGGERVDEKEWKSRGSPSHPDPSKRNSTEKGRRRGKVRCGAVDHYTIIAHQPTAAAASLRPWPRGAGVARAMIV